MGLGARWLVSFALLVLPVAVTLGILFGLQSRYQAGGGKGSFTGPGDGGLTPIDNKVTFERSCEIATGLGDHRRWKGQEYILNPNQWGLEKGQSSNLCMDIEWHNNGSYPTKTTAPKFSVTWQYPQGPESAPVHAYPNIKLQNVFPKKVQDVAAIDMELEWTYAWGNDNMTKSDIDEDRASELNANVAVDLFLDSDQNDAQNPEKADFEIMVWFAAIGGSTQPLGPGTVVHTFELEKNQFDLFIGHNGPSNIDVFTWIPKKAVEVFDGDIYPLIDYVIKNKQTGTEAKSWPVASDYIGYLGMGTEAYYAPRNVTFYVPNFSVDVKNAS